MAAVGRIMVVVMNREFAQFLPAELTAAPGTDPRRQFEGLPPIGLLLRRLVAPPFGDPLVLAFDR
jgi:hypothetical protein